MASTKHAGILYRAGSKVLLMKRRADDNHGGTWAFPAGKIEAGESSLACAVREMFEETGKQLNEQDVLAFIMQGDFELFRFAGDEFIPTLNEEHTEWQWADHTTLPDGLHPGVAESIAAAFSYAMDYADVATQREKDRNGYVTINRNPITRAGIFQYIGRALPDAEDPEKLYNVYRPLEELSKPETLKSMALLPIINDHEMLGDGYQRGPEDRGVHGATGEEIVVDGIDILAPIRIFSRSLKSLIEAGKKGLSLGYRCTFEKSAGEFQGMRYDYIQREIRGNHLALVNEGRSGTAVLDHHWACDSFDLALDTGVNDMAEECAKDEAGESKEMTVAELSAAVTSLLPLLETVSKLQGTTMANPTTALDTDEDKKDKAEDETSEEKKDKAEDGEDEDKKDKAEDGEEKDDKKEKDAMDAVDTRFKALESRIPSEKQMRAQIAATDALALRVAKAGAGTFDHSAMDEADVVKYAADKFGIKPTREALDGYLVAVDAKKDTVGFAMDSAVVTPKQGGLLSKRLSGNKA